jgi:hypothetical protein
MYVYTYIYVSVKRQSTFASKNVYWLCDRERERWRGSESFENAETEKAEAAAVTEESPADATSDAGADD